MQEEALNEMDLDGDGVFVIEDVNESTADAEVLRKEVTPTKPRESFSEVFVQRAISATATQAKKVTEFHRKHPYRTLAAAAVGGLLIGLLVGYTRRR